MLRGLLALIVAAGTLPVFAHEGDRDYRDDREYRDDRGYHGRGKYKDKKKRGRGNGRYDDRYGYGNDRYGYGNDRYGDGRYERSGYGGLAAVDRAMNNLQRAGSWSGRLDNHERKHIDEGLKNLYEFRDRLERQSRFDNGKLNKAIEHIDHLSRADRLSSQDRRMLASDVRNLQNLRSSGGRIW